MKMRFKVVAAAMTIVMSIALLSALQSPSVATTGSGGQFVPVPYASLGTDGMIASAAAPKTISVLGVAGIPSSGVSAVMVDVSAAGTSATDVYVKTTSAQTVHPVLSVGTQPGYANSTAVVKPNFNGTIVVSTSGSTVNFGIDVQGYFTEATAGGTGGFVPVAQKRVYDSGTPNSFPKNTAVAVQVSGANGIPSDAKAVFANIRVKAWSNGAFWALPSTIGFNNQYKVFGRYSENRFTNDMSGTVQLSPDGKIYLYGSDSSSIPLGVTIDVQGYFSGTSEGGAYTAIPWAPLFNTTWSGYGGPLAPGEEREISAYSANKIPSVDSATPPSAISISATAKNWSATGGSLAIYNPDTGQGGTSNLSWTNSYANSSGPVTSTAVVGVSSTGTVMIKNESAYSSVDLELNVNGWFRAIEEDKPADDAPPPAAQDPGTLCTDASCEPRMVAGVASAPIESVQAFAVPLASDSLNVAGAEADYLPLPDTGTTIDGSGFEVGVSPADIPAGYVNAEGIVDVKVAVNMANDSVETGTASVQAVTDPTDPNETVWAAPSAVTASEPAPASAARTADASAASIAVQADSTVPPASTDGALVPVAAGQIAVENLPEAPSATASRGKGGLLSCKDSYVSSVSVPSVIGTAYPISGTTGSFEVTKSTGGTYGIAASASGTGGWAEVGAKFKRNTGWGSSFNQSGAQRSFRVQVQFKKYKTVCTLKNKKFTSYEMRIIDEAGTTTEQGGLDRPNFPNSNCSPQGANSTWSRRNSSGSHYSASGGVKFLKYIGIDLSTDRSYSSESKLVYKIGSKSVRLCGSDKLPGDASKIMIKKA